MKRNEELKGYERAWKANPNNEKKSERGFGENINNLDSLYEYQKWNKNKNYSDYSEYIQKLINNNNDEKDFMSIINWIALWKTDRIIEFSNETKIEEKLNMLKGKTKKDFEKNEYKDAKEAMKLLLEDGRGIRLAMASTIMHFYNPEVFPIIDKRAYRAINNIFKNNELDFEIQEVNTNDLQEIKNDTEDRIEKYFEYVEQCKKLVKALNSAVPKQKIDMGRIDQFLYELDLLTGENIKDVPIK